MTSSNAIYTRSSPVFAPGSGPVDYFFAAIVFLSIPATIIGHIILYMNLNKRGRESLIGTPFADEVEKGFTFSQIAWSIVSGAKNLISFGSRGSGSHSATESDFTNSNGFINSNFTIVNNPADNVNGKGPVLPAIATYPPMNITTPVPAKTTVDKISVSATVTRPTSPFSRPAVFHGITRNGPSPEVGAINVVTSTHKHEDSLGAGGLVESRVRIPPSTWGPRAPVDISFSGATAEGGNGATSVGGIVTAKATERNGTPTTWVSRQAIYKNLPPTPRPAH